MHRSLTGWYQIAILELAALQASARFQEGECIGEEVQVKTNSV